MNDLVVCSILDAFKIKHRFSLMTSSDSVAAAINGNISGTGASLDITNCEENIRRTADRGMTSIISY